MLVRAYRITDRLGVALLKSSAGLSATLLDGSQTMMQGGRQTLQLLLALGLSLLAGLFGLIRGAANRLRHLLEQFKRLLIWLAHRLRRMIGRVLATAQRTKRTGTQIGGRTARMARISTTGAATQAMARRSARAEMEAGLAEDPLRAQNRMLSALVVITLVILIVVVIWATANNGDDSTPLPPGAVNLGNEGGDATTQPQASQPAGSGMATPVPTATTLPEVLQVQGSLAYVVRERGQTDIWAVSVGSRTPIRIVNSPEDDRDPDWSHNGMRLAYASRQEDSNWDIYVYDLNADTTVRMTYNLAFEGRPKWSPDDAFLMYEAYQPNTHLDIFVMPSDPNSPEAPIRLGASSDAPDFSPTWSPDGRRIAFVSWREGNQDIYIFSLNSSETYNLTRTPSRHEDYPVWSPDGRYLAYSAIEAGIEIVFVQEVDNPNAQPVAFARGHTPAWSPAISEITSLIFTVDATDSTLLAVSPFEGGVATDVIQAPAGATMPVWTSAPLPANLINDGGLPLAIEEPLYVEQVNENSGDPPYGLGSLGNVTGIESTFLSDRVNDSFNALRLRVNEEAGLDFLGELGDALWDLNRRPQPGEPNQNWHRTGRAFSFNRNLIVGFPPPVEIVREEIGLQTYWRVYVRVAEEAQSGQLGEPLRNMPWDFLSRGEGDIEAYDQGGRIRDEMPSGYYVDLTQLAADYGWIRWPTGTDWRDNFNVRNYWMFVKPDGLTWYEAMRELYTESQLGAWVPTPTPTAAPTLSSDEG